MALYERSWPFERATVACLQGADPEHAHIVEFPGYRTALLEIATGREEVILVCKQPQGWEVISPDFGLSINNHATKTRQLAIAELIAERPNGKTLAGAYFDFVKKERKPGNKLMKIYDEALRDYYKRKESEERC